MHVRRALRLSLSTYASLTAAISSNHKHKSISIRSSRDGKWRGFGRRSYGGRHRTGRLWWLVNPLLWMKIYHPPASSTPTSSLTWISWFCGLPGHEYFCEVSEDFIEDDFNLTGLNSMVPFWKEAMEMVLDVEPGRWCYFRSYWRFLMPLSYRTW